VGYGRPVFFDDARIDVAAYLQRLGVALSGPPSAEQLADLHRSHVARVPYETLEIQLGRPTTVDPYESAARVIAGRGGYCYHLNGAFSALLHALGYDVTWHVGGVFRTQDDTPGPNANHLALTVRLGESAYFVDTGLGNALYEPIPLRPGAVVSGPFRFAFIASPVAPGGWRFIHDPTLGSFAGMDFAAAAARPEDFAARHLELSTSPSSPFVAVSTVQRRTATGIDSLKGCTLTRLDGTDRQSRVLESADEWFGVLSRLFGLALHDVSPADRANLWQRVWAGHLDWLDSTDPADGG
jgi:arylamine N-acetyltransferase